MKHYIKKYQLPYEPLNKNYPDEVMKHWWLGDDKKFREAVKNYDNYYGTILPEAEITASKITPTETPNWTSEHNIVEDNKKYEQAHQAESLKIASAVSNKMNEAGNVIGTTALIGGMTVPALVASPVAFAGGMLGGYLGAKATDKVVDWSTDGKYNTWADWLVNKADTKYINHNIAEILNPGALVGGTVGGIFTKPAASWTYRNGKYAYNTKFKGVAKDGDMSEYVPQTIKNQVEAGIEGTKNLLKELGVTDLPYSKITYKNNPIYNSEINGIGDITIGFNSKTLKNPFKFYKAYTGGSKAGLNYGFVGGHEYAHTVHPTKVVIYNELGVPINNTNLGISRDLPISENSIIYNSKTGKLYPEGEYFTADKLLLESGLFLDINTPRKNIMKGLPNKSGNQAHLRAPLEFDADLYALKNLGYIKDGKVSDEGIKFLMERHNLSKEGVLNTLDDLRTIGYGNAVSGEPINGLFIAKPENIRLSGFAGAPDRFGIKPSKLTEAERLGIPKGGKVPYTPEENNAFRNQINKFAEKYGYNTIGDEVTDPEVLEKYARALIKLHNTFYRGISYAPDEATLMKWASKPRPNAEMYITPYSDVAKGYGDPVELLRPYKLGSDRTQWFTEGNFDIIPSAGDRISQGYSGKYGIYAPWVSRKPVLTSQGMVVPKPKSPESELVVINMNLIPKRVIYKMPVFSSYIKPNGDYRFSPWWKVGEMSPTGSQNLPNMYAEFKQGGSIHIKEKNKGKFTESANL